MLTLVDLGGRALPGFLRKTYQGCGRLDEPPRMGGRHPRKAGCTYAYNVLYSYGLVLTHGLKTPWEGGVYKLMMTFPEGASLHASTYGSLRRVAARRLPLQAAKV